jgi:uncharacterized repeat protein (TIGR01451 family)
MTTLDTEPEGIAVAPDGNVYIGDFANNSVSKYSPDGTLIGTFIPPGSGGLSGPRALIFGPDGKLYVSSSYMDNRVLQYDGTTGAPLGAFVTNGLGGLANPHGLVFDSSGNLYAASSGNNKVIEYDPSGNYVRVFTSGGGLNFPFDLKFLPGGDLLVTGFGSFDVRRYDGSTGTYKGVFGQADQTHGGLINPSGMAFGPDGNLYVANGSVTLGSAQGVVRRFNGTTGAFIDQFVFPVDDPIYIVFVYAPSITKQFSPASIGVGGTTTLEFTITNTDVSGMRTNLAFTDVLPAGVQVASVSGVTGSCNNSLASATPGSNTVSISGLTLQSNSSCSFTVQVTGITSGMKNNQTGTLTSDQGSGKQATATLNVLTNVDPPTLSKSFGTQQISYPGPDNATTLSFTVTNPASNPITLDYIAFVDTLPPALVISKPAGVSNNCGGIVSVSPGDHTVALSNVSLTPGSSCLLSVNVTAADIGNVRNTTSPITSLRVGAQGAPATAVISIVDLYFLWFFMA